MSKPRRNDPCPCGSGKKYKKCCLESNVIAFNPASYNDELDQLNVDLLEYAVTHFEDELLTYTQKYATAYLELNDPETLEIYVSCLTSWIILYQQVERDKTIFDLYYAEKSRKVKYPRTKKILSSWAHTTPGIFKVIDIETQPVPQIIVEDLSTKKTYNCEFDADASEELGDIIIGLLVPYVSIHEFLFCPITVGNDREEGILALIQEWEADHKQIKEVFPEMLAEIIQSSGKVSLEWSDYMHMLVVEQFSSHMFEKGFDQTFIDSGVMMWYTYCHYNDPYIRKHEGHAASLEYIMRNYFMDNERISQSQLAKEYGTTAGAISTNYQKILEHLRSEIDKKPIPDHELHPGGLSGSSLPGPSSTEGPFNMEAEMRNIQKILEDQDFEDIEEAEEYLNHLLKDGNIPTAPMEPRDIAQDLIHQAGHEQGAKKKKLIEEALDIYPSSPDAYVLLAEDAKSMVEKQHLLQKAISVGEKDLGKGFFKENKGHFWGLIETRPYMRAKAYYAMELAQVGFAEGAIEIYEELLELNPNDNQGNRDELLSLYIFIEDFTQAKKLIQTYKNDITAQYLFNKALVAYLTEGVTAQSLSLLEEADNQNEYVLDYLLQLKKIPELEIHSIQLGGETEAVDYVQGNIHLWGNAKQFLEAYLEK